MESFVDFFDDLIFKVLQFVHLLKVHTYFYKFYQEVTLPLRKKQVEMGVELQQEFRLNCSILLLGFSKIIEPVSYLTHTPQTLEFF